MKALNVIVSRMTDDQLVFRATTLDRADHPRARAAIDAELARRGITPGRRAA